VISNPLAQINSINATVTTLNSPDNNTYGYLYETCSDASSCGEGNSTTGFTGYLTSYNETVGFWLFCTGDPTWNTTLTVTAEYVGNFTLLT